LSLAVHHVAALQAIQRFEQLCILLAIHKAAQDGV
jgi:hypothetical protein